MSKNAATILIQTRVNKKTAKAIRDLAEREAISVAAYVRRLLMQKVVIGPSLDDLFDPSVKRRRRR